MEVWKKSLLGLFHNNQLSLGHLRLFDMILAPSRVVHRMTLNGSVSSLGRQVGCAVAASAVLLLTRAPVGCRSEFQSRL